MLPLLLRGGGDFSACLALALLSKGWAVRAGTPKVDPLSPCHRSDGHAASSEPHGRAAPTTRPTPARDTTPRRVLAPSVIRLRAPVFVKMTTEQEEEAVMLISQILILSVQRRDLAPTGEEKGNTNT